MHSMVNKSKQGAQLSPPPEVVADIEPVVVRHIAAELEQRGIDPGLAFDGCGLKPEQLTNEDLLVSYGQTSHIIRRALHILDDPHLGLTLGSHVNLVTWNAAYVGLLACSDSREMLIFAAEYLPSAAGLLHLRYEDSQRGPRIVAYARFDEPPVEAFLIGKAFAALTRTCKSVLGPFYGPASVDLTMTCPGRSTIYSQAFGCPVLFAQPENRMHFPAGAITVPTADVVVAKRVRKMLSTQSASSVRAHEIEASIVQALQGRFDAPPTLAQIAASMHLSERTLRRRLTDLNLGYAELLDRERKRRSLALLRSGHPLIQVAIDTGFADVRSLRRAVKRWTGQSPTALKRNHE